MKKKDDGKKREVSFSEDNHIDIKNPAIEAVYPDGIKASDLKMMRFVMSQCKKGDTEFFEYEFNATDIADHLNLDRHNLYREALKMTEERLFNCNLKIGSENDHELVHIFKKCKYKNGTFVMRMDDEASKYFLELRNNFTEIPIAPILTMKNKNSIRIYELICMKFMSRYPYADNATSINVTLEELRKVTETEGRKSYDQAGHLKERILNPSIEEIEKAADWKIIVTNLKRSRQVIGFNLEVWSRSGWEVIEKYKRDGILPPTKKNPDSLPGQMSFFDILEQ